MTNTLGKQAQGMVDISAKDVTQRTATAEATIHLGEKAYKALDDSPKGDVLETAKVAGIMAAKKTPEVIPMCHPLELQKVKVSFERDEKECSIKAIAEISCLGRTGVEMEALTAVSAAALTIYDMMKWADKGMTITNIQLNAKSGGKSGDYKKA